MMTFGRNPGRLTALWCLGACLLMGTPAQAEDKAPAPCALHRFGDCCTVVIGQDHDATINTGFNSAAQVNFIVIVNKGQSDCTFLYDGIVKVPMRSYVGGFNGTWLGDGFTLRYQSDVAKQGACPLDIYYMAIGHDFPEACLNGHFEGPLSKHSETEPAPVTPNVFEQGADTQSGMGEQPQTPTGAQDEGGHDAGAQNPAGNPGSSDPNSNVSNPNPAGSPDAQTAPTENY